MSKKNNVNPDHYKTGGRTYKGEEIVQSIHKRKLRQTQKDAPLLGEKHGEQSGKAQKS